MAKYRDRRLMVYVSSSLGEDRVLWGGCMKRRVPQNTLGRKIDNFWSTYAWNTSQGPQRPLGSSLIELYQTNICGREIKRIA